MLKNNVDFPHPAMEVPAGKGNLTGAGTEKAFTLKGADGIRAIACLAVVVHHIAQKLAMQSQPAALQEIQSFLLLGNTGVSAFFVLSGFLLSYPFWKQFFNGGQFPDIKNYAFRRAARIMPGYYASFLFCALIVLVFRIPSEHLWIRFFSGLTFTAGFHYVTFFPNEINSPFWSIGFEVFCYFLMPVFLFLMFRLFQKKRSFLRAFVFWIGVLGVVAAGNWLIHLYLTPDDFQKGWSFGIVGGAKYWMPNYNPLGFFGHFSIGIIASCVTTSFMKGSGATRKFKEMGGFDFVSAAGVLGAVLFLWSVRHAPEFSFSFQNQPYFFPCFALLIGITLAAAPHSLFVGNLLDNGFFRFTAKISFGIYIWHYLIMYVVTNTFVKDYQYMAMNNLMSWAAVSLGVILLSYGIATLSFRFIEKPVLDRAHRKKASL